MTLLRVDGEIDNAIQQYVEKAMLSSAKALTCLWPLREINSET